MPSEQQFLVAAVAVIATIIVIWLSLRRNKWREELGDTADLDPSYRDGPTLHYGEADRLDKPWRDAEANLRKHPPKETFHPHPFTRPREHVPATSRVPFGQRAIPPISAIPHIVLTPRHLEHINILRRRDGKLPMNATGFRAAIARQATTAVDTNPIRSTNDWLTYLILYEVLPGDHGQHRVAVDASIVVAPGEPFNGQGGVFAGAGATSTFDTPVTDPLADRDGLPATQGLTYVAAGGLVAALHGAALEPDPSDGGPEAYNPPAAAPEPAPAPQPVAQPDPPTYQASDPPASAPASAPDASSGGPGD